ncbi:putative inner membrane protein [Patulibacter medicamentivorans]|uniref:Putative inner membrane protein n=1 Tax=Patulibacter medicamentivorans TaxID=1097667 RepID=H0E1D5_9ACTN|nr:glycosyltransferase family 39 protein [Patulibacter medicamentivorans]EHN12489.1 putative inner membrane protein [Patulibacter medicamentivorans]
MTAATATRQRLARRGGDAARWLLGPGAAVSIVALLAWSVFLRTRNLDAPFWIDEGISVGVANFPFSEIPSELGKDGNPPVYYLLLHLWLRVFGDGESAAHALSATFAVATVPFSYLLAKVPFGRRTAVAAAAVAAVLPYLTYFGQETRMYAMVAFLSLLVAGAHLRVFEQGARAWRVALVVVLIVLLYTHSWGVFLVGGSVLAVGTRALLQPRGPERMRVIRIGFLIHLAAAVVWLPWIPTLIRQARDTGAPWSLRPDLSMLLEGLGSIAQPQVTASIFVVALVFGFAALGAAARGRLQGPAIPAPREAADLRGHATVLGVLLLSTLLFAWIGSLLSPAWANRYMGVLVGPAVLLAGLLLTRSGRIGVTVLVVLLLVWGTDTQGGRLNGKGTPVAMADAAAGELRAGDLVISTHPEQLPVIAYDLRRRGVPDGVRYATALGRQPDVRIFDWRKALDRLQAAEPWMVARRLVDEQRPGSRVLLVLPVLSAGNWQGPWTRLVADRSRAWRALLQADPRLQMVGRRPVTGPGRGVFGVLFTVRP